LRATKKRKKKKKKKGLGDITLGFKVLERFFCWSSNWIFNSKKRERDSVCTKNVVPREEEEEEEKTTLTTR
jgi:hypothetical protein